MCLGSLQSPDTHILKGTPLTMSQLLDSHTQLEAACRDRDLSRISKGVVTNVHCLAKFSREAGLTPYMGHAHYLRACCLLPQEPDNI